MRSKSKAAYMISSVAEQYSVHPQTLRLYEREGLLKPSRSDGNTRLYTEEDLERLENQSEDFVKSPNFELANRPPMPRGETSNSLVPVIRTAILSRSKKSQ